MAKSETGVWQQLPGGATDIGVGADGHVWVAGTGGVPHYWESFDPSSPVLGDWPVAPPNNLQGVTRIAVDPNGLPWAIVNNSQIMRRTGSQFPFNAWDRSIPGGATDIGIGAAGHIWVVGGGGVPHYWESFGSGGPGPGDWPVPANSIQGATRIAVDPIGLPWVILQNNLIMRRTGGQFPGTQWEQFTDTEALDIGIDPGNIVWIIAKDGTPMGWDWDASIWVPQPGVLLTSISVGPDGQAWGVAANEYIFRWLRPID